MITQGNSWTRMHALANERAWRVPAGNGWMCAFHRRKAFSWPMCWTRHCSLCRL